MKSILSNLLFLLCIFFCNQSFADICSDLRKKYLTEKNASKSDLKILEEKINANDLCVKNLFGVLLTTGNYFELDMQKAYSVFYDLSEKNYPPATLNLAIFISKDDNTDAYNVIYLLLGIYANNLSSKQWSSVAIDARDFGRNYLDKKFLLTTNDVDRKTYAELKNIFEESVKSTTTLAANDLLRQYELQRQNEDMIAGLLMLGLSASRLANFQRPQLASPTLGVDSRGNLYHLLPSRTNIYWGIPLK